MFSEALLAIQQLPPSALALAAGALVLAAGVGVALGVWSARSGAASARDAFAAVAADALRENTEGFLALAGERFQRFEDASGSDWEMRRKALDEMVAPLRESLDRYRRETRELEQARTLVAGELREQLGALANETTRLSAALRGGPAARGRWGELTLRRTAELAGMSEHCDFAEQVTIGKGGASARPDMLVRLPGGRELVVDAKAPLDAYFAAADAEADAARADALRDHARQVRRHVDSLASREYTAALDLTPDFVVLFLPDEGFLGAAIANDAALVEHALGKGVVLATPATLYALLGAVARGWREAKLADGAREVLACARELDERLERFVGHLAKTGAALDRSVDAFNQAMGSFESRVLPQARRVRELGAGRAGELAAPERIARAVRGPNAAPDAS